MFSDLLAHAAVWIRDFAFLFELYEDLLAEDGNILEGWSPERGEE